MAIIGNSTAITDNNNLDDGILELIVDNSFTYTAAANQEVWKIWLYEAGALNAKDITIAVYDITTSEVNATLVASGIVTTINSANGWRSTEITPVALIEGHTYAVLPLNLTGSTLTFKGSVWLPDGPVRLQTVASLPATLAATSTSNKAVAAYAETRDATSGSAIEVTSVNGGSTVADGDANVNIAGIDFDATTNIVTISPDTDINNANAVVQSVVTTNSAISIDITADLPAGSSSDDPVYLFVEDASSNVSDAFAISVTAIDTTPLVLELTDNGQPVSTTGTLVVCQSALGFNTGMSVTAYRSATSETPEPATSVTWVDVGNTAEPQLVATFPNGDLVSGDAYKYSYDDTVGDIQAETGGQPLASFTDKDGTVC